MHCQTETARFLVEDKGAAYVFTAVKDNQPGLFARLDALPWAGVPVSHVMRGRGHGRVETRTIQVLPAPLAPADPAPARLPLAGTDARDHRQPRPAAVPGVQLLPVHVLDHRVAAAQHRCPYPGRPHVVPHPLAPVSRNSDTTDGDGVPRPALALALATFRPDPDSRPTQLGTAVVQAGRRPPRRGPALTTAAPSGQSQARIRPARQPALSRTARPACPQPPPRRSRRTSARPNPINPPTEPTGEPLFLASAGHQRLRACQQRTVPLALLPGPPEGCSDEPARQAWPAGCTGAEPQADGVLV